MKRFVNSIMWLIFVSILTTLISCTKSDTPDANPQPTLDDVTLLYRLGYDTTNLIEYKEYYTLPPDLILSKSRLDEIRNTFSQTRMQKDPAGFLSKEYQTIYIKDLSAGDLTTNLHYAIEEWNNLEGTNLKFIVDNNAARTVQLDYGYDGDAMAYLSVERPNAGCYGTHIRVNLSREKWGTLAMDATLGKYLIMHALGHIVGFSHAVTDPMITTPQPNHISGTFVNDPQSIMRSENEVLNFVNQWSGFSIGDRQAIKQVYPYIPPVVTEEKTMTISPSGTGSENNYLSLGTDYELTAKYVSSTCPNPKYKIEIKKTDFGASGYHSSEKSNGVIAVRFTRPGIYKITAQVTNASDITISRTFYIPAQEPWIEGPASISLNSPARFEIHCWNPKFPYPNFCVTATESAFNDPDVIISPKTSTQPGVSIYDITFRQPGQYTLIAFMSNGPTNKTSKYFVNVYCDPTNYILELEKDSINAYEYSNRIRFFSNKTQSGEIVPIPYRIIFHYSLQYESTVYIKSMTTPLPNKPLPEGAIFTETYNPEDNYKNLPNTTDKITGKVIDPLNGLCLLCNKPFYEITYPQNKSWEENPYE